MNNNIIIDARQQHAANLDARHAGRVWNDGDIRTLGSIGRAQTALTRDQLLKVAPSIFAEAKHARTSDRYSFLPTSSILDGMEREGWVPVLVQEQGVRTEDRRGFQKHLIRFAQASDLQLATVDRPEIVLLNSHDRSCAYQLHAGIFRTVCMNGLVVCDATFARHSITHIDFDPAKVIEASFEIVRGVPALMDGIADMKRIELTSGESEAFAKAAVVARWEDEAKAPVRPVKLLEVKRQEDAAPTLWNTLNTVQERLMQGGQKDWQKRTETGKRAPKSRGVKGIDQNVGLNKALWTLAEEMRKLKA